MQLVIATGNSHKLREIREILGSSGVSVVGMCDFPGLAQIEEDGGDVRGERLEEGGLSRPPDGMLGNGG